MKEIAVLIVDDEKCVRESLSAFLTDFDLHITTAESAASALQILKETKIDTVIVDLRLPGIDGFTFIRQAQMMRPDINFIIFTGSVEIGIPPDFFSINNVSSKIFHKPILDLQLLVDEIIAVNATPEDNRNVH